MLSDVTTNEYSREATAAAISSNLGRGFGFSGAALDLDIMIVAQVPCSMYTTALYACGLASANT